MNQVANINFKAFTLNYDVVLVFQKKIRNFILRIAKEVIVYVYKAVGKIEETKDRFKRCFSEKELNILNDLGMWEICRVAVLVETLVYYERFNGKKKRKFLNKN